MRVIAIHLPVDLCSECWGVAFWLAVPHPRPLSRRERGEFADRFAEGHSLSLGNELHLVEIRCCNLAI